MKGTRVRTAERMFFLGALLLTLSTTPACINGGDKNDNPTSTTSTPTPALAATPPATGFVPAPINAMEAVYEAEIIAIQADTEQRYLEEAGVVTPSEP